MILRRSCAVLHRMLLNKSDLEEATTGGMIWARQVHTIWAIRDFPLVIARRGRKHLDPNPLTLSDLPICSRESHHFGHSTPSCSSKLSAFNPKHVSHSETNIHRILGEDAVEPDTIGFGSRADRFQMPYEAHGLERHAAKVNSRKFGISTNFSFDLNTRTPSRGFKYK